jgi:hypothetical protein
MNFVEEAAEAHSLPVHVAATYKFFELFKVFLGDSEEADQTRGLHWCDATDPRLSDEALRALKTLLKANRQALRKGAPTPADCRSRAWFWMQKLFELKAFDRYIRREILHWFDITMERTLEGCEMRIESVKGAPGFLTVLDPN